MTGLPIRSLQFLVIVAAVTAATGLWLIVDVDSWVGSWSQTGAALESSTRLSYPLVAAIAAWVGSSPRRQKFDPLLAGASRPRAEIYSRSCAAIAIAAATGTLIPIIGASITTGIEANFGTYPILALLVVWSGLFAAAAFGIVVGATVPPILAGPVAAVAVYAFPLVADSGRNSLAPLAGLMVADDRDRTYFQTASEFLGLRAVLLIATAWLFVAVAARSSNRWLVPFTMCCLLAVPLLLTGRSAMKPIAGATDEICVDGRSAITICLTRARSHAEPGIRAAVKSVSKILDPLGPRGILYREELLNGPSAAVLSNGQLVVPFAATSGVNGEAHRVNSRDLAAVIINRTLRDNCKVTLSPDATGRPYATASDVLQEAAFKELGIPVDGSGPLDTPLFSDAFVNWSKVSVFREAWQGAPQSARAEWLRQHRASVVGCDLRPEDLVL